MSRWVVLSLALWLIAAPGGASDAGVAWDTSKNFREVMNWINVLSSRRWV